MTKLKKRHLNIILSEDDYQRIKKVFNAHGSISKVIRTMVMNFVKKQEEKAQHEKS